MVQIYGYTRTSRWIQERPLGMDLASQELHLQRVGVPLNNLISG